MNRWGPPLDLDCVAVVVGVVGVHQLFLVAVVAYY